MIGHLTKCNGMYASKLFFQLRSWDAKKKLGYWKWNMTLSNVPTYLKKRLKPLVDTFGTKQFHKSSYTVFEGPLKEKCGEWTKVKLNAFWFKVTSILGWKSSMKRGRSTLASGWSRWLTPMVSLNGVAGVLKISAHNVWMYSPTWARAYEQRNRVDGGGVGSKFDCKHLQEVKVNPLIVCSFYNVSQSPLMYQCKQTQVSRWPFSPPHGRNDKHQEMNNNKNAKLQYKRNQMLIKIKGYAMRVKHQLKDHMVDWVRFWRILQIDL